MKNLRTFALSLASIFVLILTGCVTQPVQQAEAKAAKQVASGVDAKPIQFRKVIAKLRRGEEIGQSQIGLFCIPSSTIDWRGGRANVADEEFTEVFREELQKYNYPVVGDPNALFDDPSAWKAELLVAGLINKIQLNACYPMAGFGNYRESKGAAFIRVNWQIYGQLERKVIYETTTEGSFEAKAAVNMGIEKAMTNAFALAVQNLLADQGFHALVTQRNTSSAVNSAIPASPLVLSAQASQTSLQAARDATVTVFAGGGHGSGFLISTDGHVLTNEHVVREARFVRVRLANGREVLGDVVRSNTPQDVALIKLREGNLPSSSLAIGLQPQVGTDVYAIGTPRRESLDSTISRGIVSAWRDQSGIKLIQSDVQIHPGNSGGPLVLQDGRVVGLAVSGLVAGGISQNLNFFLPIDDAIKALNLKLQ
jgi:serine protease Do